MEHSLVVRLPPLDLLQRYEIDEAAAYLRIGRSRLYQKIADREIATIKDGGRRLVPGTEIARLSRV
jgi:excisionase family DNA binding protein